MPNWIEGTMKVRGNSENLKNFIENAIEANVEKREYATVVEYGDGGIKCLLSGVTDAGKRKK